MWHQAVGRRVRAGEVTEREGGRSAAPRTGWLAGRQAGRQHGQRSARPPPEAQGL